MQSEVGTGLKNNLFAAPLWFDLERAIEMLNKRLRNVAQDSSWLSLLQTSPKFTFPAECHTKTCRYILKYASLNDFVWKQFRWILMAKYAANTAWVLLIDKVSFSLGVFFSCQANSLKKKRENERCAGFFFFHCLTNLSSLLDLLPPSAKQFPWIKEGVENHNACVPNVGANSEDGYGAYMLIW